MDYFYNRCLHVYPGFADAPGYRTRQARSRRGCSARSARTRRSRREGLKWKDFIDEGYVIAGSPKTVRERLREAMKTLNCGHLMILQQIGSMPPELVRKSTDLFAREVMPHLRDLWTDFEDKWSPKRAAGQSRWRCRRRFSSRRTDDQRQDAAAGRVRTRRRSVKQSK